MAAAARYFCVRGAASRPAATLKVAPCKRGEGWASVPSVAISSGGRAEPKQPRSVRTRGKRGGATAGRARPAPLL
ncbi:hypothetical protein NDU88_001213 [Pleurodeles waltl]|uniref:Uncharacterized protein n=1 Tax=Pleurodeles waltl TaxID=8319 RepID=A0AAV7V7U0_PLEWA|nr:hypothetical protein NDU88_001213 [Pleurodeles waltl]